MASVYGPRLTPGVLMMYCVSQPRAVVRVRCIARAIILRNRPSPGAKSRPVHTTGAAELLSVNDEASEMWQCGGCTSGSNAGADLRLFERQVEQYWMRVSQR